MRDPAARGERFLAVTGDSMSMHEIAMLLRARTLIDVDCWSEVKGQPIKPGSIRRAVLDKLHAAG